MIEVCANDTTAEQNPFLQHLRPVWVDGYLPIPNRYMKVSRDFLKYLSGVDRLVEAVPVEDLRLPLRELSCEGQRAEVMRGRRLKGVERVDVYEDVGWRGVARDLVPCGVDPVASMRVVLSRTPCVRAASRSVSKLY